MDDPQSISDRLTNQLYLCGERREARTIYTTAAAAAAAAGSSDGQRHLQERRRRRCACAKSAETTRVAYRGRHSSSASRPRGHSDVDLRCTSRPSAVTSAERIFSHVAVRPDVVIQRRLFAVVSRPYDQNQLTTPHHWRALGTGGIPAPRHIEIGIHRVTVTV